MDREAAEQQPPEPSRRESLVDGKRDTIVRGVLFAAVGIVALLAVFYLGDLLLTGDRIHRGVSVSGADIGGMSESEAAVVLKDRLEPALRRPASVRHRSRTWSLDPTDFALQVGFAGTASRAAAVGRDGGLISNLGTRMSLWFRPQAVDLMVSANEDRLQAALRDMANAVRRPPVNASLAVSGTRVNRTGSHPGQSLSNEAARKMVIDCMVSPTTRTGELPVVPVPVGIDDNAVSQAYVDARAMLAAPLLLRHGRSSWKIPPATVGRWIVFRRKLASSGSRQTRVVITAGLSQSGVAGSVSRITKGTRRPAKDAQFEIVGERVRIVRSRPGIGVDTARACAAISAAVLRPGQRAVKLVDGPLQPRLTTEWARSTGITRLLGTYTTNYDSGQTSRVANIHLLLRHLNNTFIRPRGVFSFNKTIGPRTAEEGYQEAPAIQGGKLVPSLGGGVCQVGTTLFNSVFFSGLDVVERHNHSFYISHYPDGRDATVSWDGPDLKFRNDTATWVLLKAWWGEDWVTISLYGGNISNDVSYRTSEFSNFTDPPMERVEDPTLAAGETVVDDEGLRGRDITVWRVVRRNGKIIHKDTFGSSYSPRVGTTRVGTKQAPKPSKEPSRAAGGN